MSLNHSLKKFAFKSLEQIKFKRSDDPQRNYIITFTIKFGYPVIISNFQLTREIEETPIFEFAKIEGNLLGDFVDYEEFLDTNLDQTKNKGNKEIQHFSGAGVGEIVNISFSIDGGYYRSVKETCESYAYENGGDQENGEDSLSSLLKKRLKDRFKMIYESITFFGISSAKSIKPYVGLKLINLGLLFRKKKMFLSDNEVKLATALALVNEKKYNQATEILRNSVEFLDSCANGISNHLTKVKKFEFSFNSLQKLWKQISGIRFRCAMISVLMSSININDMKPFDKVEYLIMALNYHTKSKKQGEERLLEINRRDDWYKRFEELTPRIVTLLSEIIRAEEAKYYKIACMEMLNHMLQIFGGSLSDNIIDIFKSMLRFLIGSCRYGLYRWDSDKRLSVQEALNKVGNVCYDNSKILKIFRDGVFEIDNFDDPYISTTPILYSNASNFLDNILVLLPNLSANILHSIFDMLMESECLFNLELPQVMRAAMTRMAEKILIICQADLSFKPSQLKKLVLIQTLLNNKDYRKRVSLMAKESEDTMLITKEIYSLHLDHLEPEELEQFTTDFSNLWVTLKNKYLFLVEAETLNSFMTAITTRMEQIAEELNTQVLTDEFKRLNFETCMNEQLSLGDLKFERFGSSSEEKKRISKNDIIKSKVEYLRNFRDVFGEFEYFLEIFDCLAANFSEKRNIAIDCTGTEIEPRVDDTSKKLIQFHLCKEADGSSQIERDCWDSIRSIIHILVEFLLIYMKDSVFIDYFASTWVIMNNFVTLLTDRRAEVALYLSERILKQIDLAGSTKYPDEHQIQCILNLLDLLIRNKEIILEEGDLKRILVIFMRRTFMQLAHNQHSNIFKLCSKMLDLFESEIELVDCMFLVNSLKDPSLDIENQDYRMLISKLFGVLVARDNDSLLKAILANLIKDTYTDEDINKEKRRIILSRRKERMSNSDIGLTVKNELYKQQRLRCLEIIGLYIKNIPFPFILSICSSPRENQDIFQSSEDTSLYSFFLKCIQEQDYDFQKGVLRALLGLINAEYDNSSASQFVTLSKLKVVRFSFRLMLKMARHEDLRPENRHDLILLALFIFSRTLPPAGLLDELQIYEDAEANRSTMLNNDNSFLRRLEEDHDQDQDPRLRYYDITCFDTLEDYFENKQFVSYGDINYTNVRLYEMFKLYVLLRKWIESPWSSIKGLVCNFISYLVPCTASILDECLQELMEQEIGSILQRFIVSKESEAIISGLNILGAFCGFGQEMPPDYDFPFEEKGNFFKRNSQLVPITVWESVYKLQRSWDFTIQIASITLHQMALPKEYARFIIKKSKEHFNAKMNDNSGSLGSGGGRDIGDDTSSLNAGISDHLSEGDRNLDKLLHALNRSERKESSFRNSFDGSSFENNENVWISKHFNQEEIRQLLTIFKLNFSLDENVWVTQQYSDKRVILKWVEPLAKEEEDLPPKKSNQENKIPLAVAQKPENPQVQDLEANSKTFVYLDEQPKNAEIPENDVIERKIYSYNDREHSFKQAPNSISLEPTIPNSLKKKNQMERITENPSEEEDLDDVSNVANSKPVSYQEFCPEEVAKPYNPIQTAIKQIEKLRVSTSSSKGEIIDACSSQSSKSSKSKKSISAKSSKKNSSRKKLPKSEAGAIFSVEEEAKKRFSSNKQLRKKKKSISSKKEIAKSSSNLYRNEIMSRLISSTIAKNNSKKSLKDSSLGNKIFTKYMKNSKLSEGSFTNQKEGEKKSSRRTDATKNHYVTPAFKKSGLTPREKKSGSGLSSGLLKNFSYAKLSKGKEYSSGNSDNLYTGSRIKNSSTGNLKFKGVKHSIMNSNSSSNEYLGPHENTRKKETILNNLKDKILNKVNSDIEKRFISAGNSGSEKNMVSGIKIKHQHSFKKIFH